MRSIDIYGENRYAQYTKVRQACRGIVIRGDDILLSYEVRSDLWMIPGGGLEEGESLLECCARELAEETGYAVNVKKHVLTIHEYYEEWLYTNHYYVCQIAGQTQRKLTLAEEESKLEPRWIPLQEAMDIFAQHQTYEGDDEMKRGAYLREYQALLAYMAG